MKNISIISKLLISSIFLSALLSCHKINNQKINTLSGKIINKTDLDDLIQNQMDSLNVKGISISVFNKGKIVYHKADGIADIYKSEGIDKTSLFESGSLAKPIFALFVMKQAEKGLIALDTPLYKYLPYPDIEYDERYKLITARMALSHTTGFPNWRWQNRNNKLDIKFQPGTKFSYSGEAYAYLAKVVAHVNNVQLNNLDSIFQKDITEPLNIKHAYFSTNTYAANHLVSAHEKDNIVYDNSWNRREFSADGGLLTESVNYAQLLIALMEKRGLKESSFREIFSHQIELPEDEYLRKKYGITNWTLGFGAKNTEYGKVLMHSGKNWGYTSSFVINLDKKSGYVFFTNSDQGDEFEKIIQTFLTQ